jgi:molybdate transport system substrate-binding protein
MASCIHRVLVVGRALQVTAILSVALSVEMPMAHAAELQVPVSIALRGPVAEVAAAFEKESGHTVKMTLAAPGEIVAAVQAGRHADVIVLTNTGLAELDGKGLVRHDRVSLATTGFGLATRTGDLAPDISTPDALRAVLLGASKVIYNDPKVTPSGQLLVRIAERLGVAEQIKAKSQVVAPGAGLVTLAKDSSPGTVVAPTVLIEVAGQPGVKLVGPLPRELQVPLPYSAALSVHPSDEMASQAFLRALASASAKQAYATAGFEVDK